MELVKLSLGVEIKRGDNILIKDAYGKLHIERINWCVEPFISNNGDVRIEYTSEECKTKVNRSCENIWLIKQK